MSDYEFYLNHSDKFTFCGENVQLPVFSSEGKMAKECFYLFDSKGIKTTCKEPEIYQKVLRTKKAINFQIKQWVEGFNDFCEPVEYYLNEFKNPPKWIRKAIENQKRRKGE